MGVQRNWKQLFLIVTYSVFIAGGAQYLLLFFSYICHKLPTKYPRKKKLDPRNTYKEKFRTRKITMRKRFGPTQYKREKILDPRYTDNEKYQTHEILTKKEIWTYKGTNPQWHDDTRPARSTITEDPQNLAHSQLLTDVLQTRCF